MTLRRVATVAVGCLVPAYAGAYLLLLRPAVVAGGGSTQRVPAYVHPLTGRMLANHLRVCRFFTPAQRIDALVRPRYWWQPSSPPPPPAGTSGRPAG